MQKYQNILPVDFKQYLCFAVLLEIVLICTFRCIWLGKTPDLKPVCASVHFHCSFIGGFLLVFLSVNATVLY